MQSKNTGLLSPKLCCCCLCHRRRSGGAALLAARLGLLMTRTFCIRPCCITRPCGSSGRWRFKIQITNSSCCLFGVCIVARSPHLQFSFDDTNSLWITSMGWLGSALGSFFRPATHVCQKKKSCRQATTEATSCLQSCSTKNISAKDNQQWGQMDVE